VTDATLPPVSPRVVSDAERLADAVVHWLGIGLALVSLPILVTLAAVWDGKASTIAAIAVYSACVVAMFGFSGAYNLSSTPKARAVLRRFDHASIYLKIAGTQTPFAVLAGGATSAWLLACVWAAAILGALAKLIARGSFDRLSVVLYLALGWAAILLIPDMWDGLSGAALALIILGGVLYTVGVGFHLWDSLPFQNAIWHGFVLAASFVFYAALMVEIVRRAPLA
jgi:hemolysin III